MAATLLFPGSAEEAAFIYTDSVGDMAKHASLRFYHVPITWDWTVFWNCIKSGEVAPYAVEFSLFVLILAGCLSVLGWDQNFPLNPEGGELNDKELE